MTTTNRDSGTRIDEVADGIYRISTPVPPAAVPGGFSFNQYLVVDEQPCSFTPGRASCSRSFAKRSRTVMPVDRPSLDQLLARRADEWGALNEIIGSGARCVAPLWNDAAMVSVNDIADRPARALADGERISLGTKSVVWIDAPHVSTRMGVRIPVRAAHANTVSRRSLHAGRGRSTLPSTESDILGPSEAFRKAMDYYSHTKRARGPLEKLALLEPTTLASMHGSAWRGQGAGLLRALCEVLTNEGG